MMKWEDMSTVRIEPGENLVRMEMNDRKLADRTCNKIRFLARLVPSTAWTVWLLGLANEATTQPYRSVAISSGR